MQQQCGVQGSCYSARRLHAACGSGRRPRVVAQALRLRGNKHQPGDGQILSGRLNDFSGRGALSSIEDAAVDNEGPALGGTGAPVALASLDDVQALEAAFATVDSLDTSDVMEAASRKQWLSGAVKGMLLLNLSAALFGSNQVVIKLAEADMSPATLSALRFGIAALCFAPAALRGAGKPQLRATALELACWLFGGYILQAWGLEYTTASRGAFTGTFTVLAVPMLVGLSGRSVPWSTWTAAAVALTGVGLLTTSGAEPNLGDAACIASAALFGVHKWRSEAATARFRDDTNQLIALQLACLAAAAALVSAPGLARLAAQGPDAVWAAASGLPWPAIAYMGLATTAFTLWVEMHALKDVSAPLAALIYTSEPLWGALFAWTLLGERWGATGWLGAALIVGSSLGAQLVGSGSKVKTE